MEYYGTAEHRKALQLLTVSVSVVLVVPYDAGRDLLAVSIDFLV